MPDDARDLKDLPLMYRLILKFPKLSLEGYSEKFQGIFWVVVVPIFLIVDFCVNLLILVFLPFPINYLGFFVATSFVAILIIRILVDRTLDTSKAMLKEGHPWDIDKAVQGYLQLLHKEKDGDNVAKETSK